MGFPGGMGGFPGGMGGFPGGMGGFPGFGPGMGGADAEVAFADFMNAFRAEMQETREKKGNLQKFVPSRSRAVAQGAAFDGGAGGVLALRELDGDDEEEDAFEWPQELLTLGLGADGVEAGTGSSTSSTSPTTSTTEDSDEDEWPDEMLM